MSAAAPSLDSVIAEVTRSKVTRARRRVVIISLLTALIVIVAVTSLMVGNTFYSLTDVVRVVLGQDVDGATFTVGRLRLPRTVLAIVVGLSFGIAGVTFQTMLRNPLASPDIIGISAGASAAAAFAIVVLGLSGTAVSIFAISAGLIVTLLIYVLSHRAGSAGTRLILIGIGIAAMLEAVTQYVLSQAGQWELQAVLRWLTGSLNGASWEQTVPALLALLVLGPLLLSRRQDLDTMRLGEDAAVALGVRIEATRLVVVIAAVGLIAFATAATGPIAFVAFLAGPIAARIVGPHGSLLVPAALVGALLVLVGDVVGQNLLGLRYPVGIVTGVLGAPYLVYLIIRTNRSGGSL